MDEDYVKNLERIIQQMLIPLKDIPFPLVIRAISGNEVIPFDYNSNEDVELLNLIEKSVIDAGQTMVKNGVYARRVNEIGNAIEPFVRDSLNKFGLEADIPTVKNGGKQAVGYPDLTISFKGKTHYVECKTYNKETENTTQRSFYLSPSDKFKVTKDGHHFLVSYGMERLGSAGSKGDRYKPFHWRILSLEKLLVSVKYEFNADNRELYGVGKGLILKEGIID
ncbi:MAG: hypothetical protein QXV37_02835 [Candidatus Jordarchaeaceae archaeon]